VTKPEALKIVRAYEKLMSFETFADEVTYIANTTEDLSAEFVTKFNNLIEEELKKLNQALADM
jgi:hypothetical protein